MYVTSRPTIQIYFSNDDNVTGYIYIKQECRKVKWHTYVYIYITTQAPEGQVLKTHYYVSIRSLGQRHLYEI